MYYPKNFRKAYNNRLSFSVQRQLPGEFVASFTFFENYGNKLYNQSLNSTNPAILQSYSPDYLNTPASTIPFTITAARHCCLGRCTTSKPFPSDRC